VRVEVVALHALGVGQDDLSHTERGELCPQTPQDFRSWQGQEQIHRRKRRHTRVERAAQFNRVVGRGLHDPQSRRAIKDADAHFLSGRDLQDTEQVSGARA